MLIEIILITCPLYACWLIWRSQKPLSTPPELPRKLPLIGHTYILYGDSIDAFNTLKFLATESIKRGGVITFSVTFNTVYAVTDPDDCETIANKCLHKAYYYNFARAWLGDSLLTAPVPVWKRYRKLLNPAFNQHILNGFLCVFNDKSRQLVNHLSAEVGKGAFRHGWYIKLSNLETICLTAMGITSDDHSSVQKEYLSAVEEIQHSLTKRIQNFCLHSDFIFNRSKLRKKQDELVKVLHKMSNMVLQQRKHKINNDSEKNISNNNKSEYVKPLMDVILRLKTEQGDPLFTDTEIREQIDNIISGGHDTTAFTITYALILIGSYPETQEKLCRELQEIFRNTDRDVEKEDLSKLTFLEAVIKETIRLYSIAPIIARYVDRDVKLKNYTIPAGSNCLILIWGMHRHPVWGPDADQFKPERWLDPALLPSNPNAFGGFSLGRRGCIGQKYVMMSMKTTLTHVLRRYKINADITKLRVKVDAILKPASGDYISIERRV